MQKDGNRMPNTALLTADLLCTICIDLDACGQDFREAVREQLGADHEEPAHRRRARRRALAMVAAAFPQP